MKIEYEKCNTFVQSSDIIFVNICNLSQTFPTLKIMYIGQNSFVNNTKTELENDPSADCRHCIQNIF